MGSDSDATEGTSPALSGAGDGCLALPSVTLFVVRHAHAGSRSAWTGDDRLRPLSERGQRQALAIAATLAPSIPRRLLSSPAQRCLQTLEPVAGELGLDIELDDRLFEGAGRSELRELLDEVADEDVVVSSHGDVIPILLDMLVAAGLEPEHDLEWQKGSIWIAERDGAGWGRGRYVPRPEVG